MVAIFNDKDERNSKALAKTIAEIAGIEIVPSSIKSLRKSRNLMQKYPDLPIDYADATTACLAIDTGIENIVTFDKKDFNIYGSEKKSDFYHNAVIRYDL